VLLCKAVALMCCAAPFLAETVVATVAIALPQQLLLAGTGVAAPLWQVLAQHWRLALQQPVACKHWAYAIAHTSQAAVVKL